MLRTILALALVAGISACSQHPTAAAKRADSVKASDLVCRGYVVTSGRDSTCAPQ